MEDVRTREDGLLKVHVPVVLAFRPRLTSLRSLVIRTPPRLPTQRIVGPTVPLPCWRAVRDQTKAAVELAKRAPPEVAQAALDEAYKVWAQKAEEELQAITGVSLPKLGLRGLGPQLVWRTIIPEKVKTKPGDDNANDHRRRCALIRDVRLAGEDARRGCRDRAGAKISDIAAAVEINDEASESAAGWRRLRAIVDDLVDIAWGGNGEPADERWCQWAESVTLEQEAAGKELAEAEYQERKAEKEAWREWVMEGISAGGKNAHRSVRLPEAWLPSTTP